ncbi:hypothetical protein CVV43_01655 [Candidatus Saccharibacteria bacterium HGW-Saccharibacteria-1]|jgi:glycosyltransferase involved in cell wall biosynthesis|nr:MAG: hypothetical protein CVV43_01655 [Candidatus Saccharibacteria bacterium HGW-Saccharibacteria-1]
MKKISIIVPVFNTADYIQDCLRCLLNQTYANIEIIVIDDGSYDGTGEILDNFEKIDDRLIVTHQKKSGVSLARNAGIKMSKGDYICFVDADDLCTADMIEYLVKISDNADVVSCEYALKKSRDISDIENNKIESIESISGKKGIEYMFYQINIDNGPCAKLYSRRIVARIRFPENTTIGEDFMFNYEVFKKAKKIIISNQKKYIYFQNPKNTTRAKFTKSRMDAVKVSTDMLDDVKKLFPELETAAKRRLFFAATRTAFSMDKELRKEHIKDFNMCRNIIRKTSKSIIFDKKSSIKDKLFALLATLHPKILVLLHDSVKKNV